MLLNIKMTSYQIILKNLLGWKNVSLSLCKFIGNFYASLSCVREVFGDVEVRNTSGKIDILDDIIELFPHYVVFSDSAIICLTSDGSCVCDGVECDKTWQEGIDMLIADLEHTHPEL